MVDIPAGSRLINVPEHGFNLLLDSRASLGGNEVNYGVHLQYVGERLGETIDPDYLLPGYSLVNLFARVRLAEGVDLQLTIHNLLDEEYYANSYSDLWTMPGAPMNYQVVLSYRF